MGIKGDKLTKDADLSVQLLVEKLSPIGDISSKKMFGGYGIFHKGKMFGIVDSKGQRFLKVDDSNKSDFEQKGAHQHSRMPYFSIPEELLSDQETLIEWANKSIEIAK